MEECIENFLFAGICCGVAAAAVKESSATAAAVVVAMAVAVECGCDCCLLYRIYFIVVDILFYCNGYIILLC